MSTANRGQDYQHWLAKINQVCGHFAARPLDGDFHGEIDTSYAGSLKLSTVTAGGVKVSEVKPNTMESKLVEGLYFAGEILDVDAYTGGFNLQIAWATGHLAGVSAAERE